MEDGHIDPTIHVPGARVGTPTTDRQSYIPHTLTHSNIYHIPYIDTYTTHRQTAIYTAYIHKHITIHSYYIQITDMHTKYRYIHIHTKTHLPQYKIHTHHTWLHSLHINYKHHINIHTN